MLNSYQEYGNRAMVGTNCPYCDNLLTHDNISRDHVIPISSGILKNNKLNILACCKSCNSEKGDKNILNFLGIFKDLKKGSFLPKKPKVKNQQCIHLEKLLELEVVFENNSYTFYNKSGRVIKSFITYPKALAFAEGILYGRKENEKS